MPRYFSLSLLAASALVACDSPEPATDAGTRMDSGRADSGSSPRCERDSDCSDNVFCNGVERCAPGPMADSAGCVAGGSPCAENATCVEAAARCAIDCAADGDSDGDGHDAVECGGDDCNDNDPAVFGGGLEVCDSAGVDEDCVPTTVGVDADGDGFVSRDCCYLAPGAVDASCGGDCDDSNSEISPSAPEACNGEDDDCDLQVDEGVTRRCWPDLDGDGVAPAGPSVADVCGDCGPGLTNVAPTPSSTDCDDSDPTRFPGAVEVCDRLDSDCSSATGDELDEDRDGDGHSAFAALCSGGFPRDDCYDDNADVYPGQAEWFADHRGDGSFDYDCRDGEVVEYPEVYECRRMFPTQQCSPPQIPCALTEGWVGSAPGCRETGGFVSSCSCAQVTGNCSAAAVSSQIQRCH